MIYQSVSGIVGRMNNKKILITGFGPFPGVPDNPSAALVDRLARTQTEFNLAARILPTEYGTAWSILAQAIRDEAPDIVICFGVASESPMIRMERQAHNTVGMKRPDGAGCFHDGPVVCDGGPQTFAATLPVADAAAALAAAGLPARVSDSAGDYLCNYIFYRLMHDIAAEGRKHKGGFVHIPLPREGAALSADGLVEAARVIIRVCAEENGGPR